MPLSKVVCRVLADGVKSMQLGALVFSAFSRSLVVRTD